MIKGIFYSEFDNIAGPIIVFQAPSDVLSNETFDSISSYIIIDKALCGKIITVCVHDLKIVGYPVCIEDDKYHRNALLFNIGFVFDSHVETEPYRPILRKLGTLMESMEKESAFLSTTETKAKLETILPQILRDLTVHGECTIPINVANVLNLKVFPRFQDPVQVYDYQVPVAIRDLRALAHNCAEWDLALQQIVPFIDGVNYVKRISLEADVQIDIVKKCMRQLLYYNCITMVDIFLHSNVYATTPKIGHLANDPTLQAECTTYITKSGRPTPPFGKVFALYCSMQPGIKMSDFCVIYAETLNSIDVRRFITFGLIHGILRRVHRYPIRVDRGGVSRQTSTSLSASPQTTAVGSNPTVGAGSGGALSLGGKRALGSMKASLIEKELVRFMDGDHHTDEMCSAFMLRFADLEAITTKDPNCFIVQK